MLDSAVMTTNQRLRIGKIVGCHGLRGDLKVLPSSHKAEWSDELEEVFLEMPPKTDKKKPGQQEPKKPPPDTQILRIESVRWQGSCVLVRFEGYPDRTAAEPLIGATLYADSDTLPEAEEDEYWVDDLIGLSVIDARTNQKTGVVVDLLSSTGSEFLEIRLDNAADTIVIPFLNHFFPTVDLAAKTVLLNLPDGFLPDSQQEES